MTHSPSLSPLQKLAAAWRLFGLLAAAFAKVMRRKEDGSVHGAREQAEQLQVICRAAHVMLRRDIAEALEAGPPETVADEHALTYLRMMAIFMLALAMIMENILERGVLSAAQWMLDRAAFVVRLVAMPAPAAHRQIPFLDSG